MEREPEPSEQAVNLCSVFSKNGGEIVSDEPMGMVNAMVMVRGPELSEQALRRQAEIESEPQLMNEPDPWEEAPEPSEQAVNDVAILSDERIGMVSAMVMERGPELSEQALRRLAEIESERQLMNPDPWEEEPEPSEQSVNQHEEQLENHPDPLEQEQVVNPWKVSAKKGGKVDYNKIIDEFGCKRLDEPLIDRVQRLTSRQPHVFLRRGVFFAHRDFNLILDAYERGDKFYLYTGRGPSSEALHLGHLIPFMFTKYLQEAFKVPLVIQLTDDEKCIWKNITVEESQRLGRENAKDIIACGFDVTKTFIFSDFDYVGGAFYKNMVKVSNCLSVNKAKATFGFTDDDQIGKLSFPPVQAVPSFPSSFPHLFPGKDNLRCLIPCAIDQDPYFRMTRDIAPRLGYCKPALIESSFFPALKGENGKMSASDPNSAIYVTDTAKDIKKKVNSAVSGGKDLAAEQAELGADLEKDVPVKYLHCFLEDDYELEHIKKEYGEGRMQTGAVKGRLVEVLTEMVERHRRARAGVTDEMVDAFMAVRPLPYMFE